MSRIKMMFRKANEWKIILSSFSSIEDFYRSFLYVLSLLK